MIAYVKIPNNEDILSIMSNLQPNCCLKVDFQKVDQHAGGKWLIHDTKRRKTNHKWCDGTMLNPIFWKKVQGQKHPVRWGIVKHQIPSIKVLFKTNTKSHRHASIRLFMREQDTIGKPKKTKSGIQPRNSALPRNTETEIQKHKASGWEHRSSGGSASNPQVSAPVPRLVVNGSMERMCQRHGSDQTPTVLFESKTHMSINSYSITYAVEECLLSIIPNSVIVLSLQYNVFCNNW